MGIKITLDKVEMSGNSNLLNGASIRGQDVEINVENTVLTDEVDALGSVFIDQSESAQRECPEEPSAKGKGLKGFLRKHAPSFVRDLAVELVSDAINKK